MARKSKYDFDLVVIGSGAGGSVAANQLARAGRRVALVEAGAFGGECPNWGCIPTKALLHAAGIYDAAKQGAPFGIRSAAIGYNYPSVKAWKDLAVTRTGAASGKRFHEAAGITVLQGAAHFIGPHEISVNRRHLSSESFLIATGSHWAVPPIEGAETADYLTAKTALDLIRPPRRLFVVGAGAVGCEFAQLFSIFGSKLFMADISPRILPKEDSEVSSAVHANFEKRRGMTLLTSTKVVSIKKEGVLKRVTFQRGGVEHSVKVDDILMAAGKLPNTDIGLENAGVEYSPKGIGVNEYLQTSARHIYAAGDVTGGYMFTHTATYESRLAAHNLLHRDKITADYRAVPRVTFLTPEVASVGMSEEDCTRRDLRISTGIAPISIIGRSTTSNEHDGFVKVIADKAGVILGASAVMPHAGEVIQELTLAIQHGITAAEVANTIHAFPTWSEAVRVACAKVA